MIEPADFYRYSLFGGFGPEDGKRIEHLFMVRQFQPGDCLIRQGEPNDAIFFLMGGSVRVYRGERVLIDFNEGDSFGEIEMLDTKPAAATITALSPAVAACLNHRSLHELSRLDPKLFSLFMMNLARDLARRLRRMDEILCGE